MKFSLRREKPPVDVEVLPGEKVLAWCEASDGQVAAGTRDAFYLTGPPQVRIPWEQVETVDWDVDTSVLRLSEVGTWGRPRLVHELTIEEPRLLLDLVRERVTASVVVQRHVALTGRQGLRVIARRAPRGDSPLVWVFEYDEGVDPAAPEVDEVARRALADLQAEIGLV